MVRLLKDAEIMFHDEAVFGQVPDNIAQQIPLFADFPIMFAVEFMFARRDVGQVSNPMDDTTNAAFHVHAHIRRDVWQADEHVTRRNPRELVEAAIEVRERKMFERLETTNHVEFAVFERQVEDRRHRLGIQTPVKVARMQVHTKLFKVTMQKTIADSDFEHGLGLATRDLVSLVPIAREPAFGVVSEI